MTRTELEQKAFDLMMASMMYNGMEDEVLEQTKAASDEDLLAFIEEV